MQNMNFNAYLDDKNTIIIETDQASTFKINGEELPACFLHRYNQYIIYKADYEIDIKNNYIITDDLNRSCNLNIRYYVKSSEFDDRYYYNEDDLGPTYFKDYTLFKLWAPIASKVILHYEINEKTSEVEMKRNDDGTFQIKVDGNLENTLYFYKVTNNGLEQITLDPYAYSANANSKKSAVINLSLINDDNDISNLPQLRKVSEAIIYEVSVRDFSMDGSLGEDVEGTFNAFLKHDVKSKLNQSIGIDYLKELGITHIQLMPIFDFATVDEENIKEKYNWGYDPFCYNILEGSYSSNPNNPYSRINEAVAMINELHKVGLRVIVDVVFNHTYSFNESIYNKIIPNYFYLMDRNGNLSNGSFCGNDIDTTKKMVKKYIVDMCIRYVKLYHVDGLRVDLMGILTKDLIMEIYNNCKLINPDFMIYGEGWNMPSMLDEHLRASLNNANQIPQISFFNDKFRDIVSGKTYNNFSCANGFLTGNLSLYYDFIKAMRGSIENGCYFQNVTSSINYVECHDNFTLYDKLRITNPNNSDEERNNIQLCCIIAILLAQGIPFLHSGMEFNRTKHGVENSYNAKDKINMLLWKDVDTYQKNIKAVKDFIDIRKTYKCFTMTDQKRILNSIDGQIINDCVLTLTYALNGEVILLIFNPTNTKQNIKLNSDYTLLANQFGYVKKDDKIYNNITIKGYGFLMLIK